MIRTAIGRVLTSRASRFAAVMGLTVTGMLVPPAGNVRADSVDDQRRRVQEIVDELERIASQADSLGERYADTLAEQETIEGKIRETEVRIFDKQRELAAMQADLSSAAKRSFVSGGSAGSLSSILGGSGGMADAVKKAYLGSVAMNSGAANTDRLQGLIDDIAKERAALEKQKRDLATLGTFLVTRLAAAESLVDQYELTRSDALRQLGSLLTEEERRRASEAESLAQREADRLRNSIKVTAPSPQASAAIKAALSQLGVRYRWGASSPGNAFDCSGLTQWAWSKAGVSIPRVSRSQFSGLTRVPTSQAQPGDLLFSQSSFFHVGIYLGNGQMVHAPRTGDVVKISTVTWSRVLGVGRPK